MRLLLVCNPGGHFATMMGLKRFWQSHHRQWVTYRKYDTEQLPGTETVHWVMMQEARMVLRAFLNFWRALWILLQVRPDAVISTGASLAVPFIVAAKLFGIHTVFIESISRSQQLSLSGRMVYNLADEFYVQWPDCLERYPKAQYRGIVA
ncbi:MAG: UDP-N-acetylglucosamine--LPS N-acetylglucosamine transferase [Chloroflexaceae bacterium]|nr:UDP-N-acetylglucosamine--LPS N-acetylglucosamine transferase [Chloroflexaceae bacterium]